MRIPASLLTVRIVLIGDAAVCVGQDTGRMDAVIRSFGTSFTGSVLVARGPDVVFGKSDGAANAEWSIPNDEATRFRVASLTKQFTAAAILLLEERGRLTLHDPVRTDLAAAPPAWDGMTIFHLLTQVGAIAAAASRCDPL